MRVFVLNAGRCGSTTLYRACCHVRNFSVSHTSQHTRLGDGRVDYPDHHIDLGNRLVWFLGRLDLRFGTEPFFVHLRRDPAAVARSYEARLERARRRGLVSRILGRRANANSGIIAAYAAQIARQKDWTTRPDVLPICEDYVRTVDENIRLFLKDKPRQMDFWLEDYAAAWPRFWRAVGAEGDYEAALAEFQRPHNATGAALEPAPHKRQGGLVRGAH